MKYCNDCFAKMEDKARHCKACQSRDIRSFVTEVTDDTSEGISKDFVSSVFESVEEPGPAKIEKIKVDPKYLVEPKPKTSDVRPKDLLYFPSNPKLAKIAQKNASRSAKAQRRSRLAARGPSKVKKPSSAGASFALFGPLALAIVFLGTVAFGVIPTEIKKGQIAWTEATSIPDRLIPLVDVKNKGSFEWLEGGKKPKALWDPCRTIYWVVNPENEPEIARQMMADAFSEVSARTGLKFEFFGETTENFNSNRSPVNSFYPKLESSWSPVIVTYLKGEQFEDAARESVEKDPEDVAAFAGPDSSYDRNDKLVYVSGNVTISSDWFSQSMNDWGGLETKGVFLHELGHLVGLDHVSDSRELMYEENTGQKKFGPGDKQGLALAGQSQCLSAFEYPDPGWADWTEFD